VGPQRELDTQILGFVQAAVTSGLANPALLQKFFKPENVMPETQTVNRRIVLNKRPSGAPTAESFRLEERVMPAPLAGELLLQTRYLSLDPYMRGRMSDGPSYAPPVALGDVMVGGTVSRVVESKNPAFHSGDLVLGFSGWQEYEISGGKGLTKLDPGMTHPSLALGVLGMPGFTAYMGLLDIGQPKAGETVVVAAASGAVGSIVGQIAKLKGCRAVGVAGGADKCRYVVDELGFDACLDHRAGDLALQLAAACPKGIDVYFESVGGTVFDAVMPLLNSKARIPVCGLIAAYNETTLPPGPDRLGLLVGMLLRKRIKMQGFIIFDDYGPRFGEFFDEMNAWVKNGKIKYREDIVDGLDNAPAAFMGLLAGKNFGKLIVKVADA
jgi:NADPH-dependent curcumin reductase